MKIAIMQPYLFPYIGYFQMMSAVDKFILLDDVSYINKGWVNRNRILVNGKEHLFTIPLREASQNKLISDIEIVQDGKWKEKLLKTIKMSYRKAPCFDLAFSLVEKVILLDEMQLNKLLLNSIILVNKYLDIETPIVPSSSIYKNEKLSGQYRILDICMKENADEYINAIGGTGLYSKELFLQNNIKLKFIKSNNIVYEQLQLAFVPWLSIIDVIMFNSRDKIKEMLNDYKLL